MQAIHHLAAACLDSFHLCLSPTPSPALLCLTACSDHSLCSLASCLYCTLPCFAALFFFSSSLSSFAFSLYIYFAYLRSLCKNERRSLSSPFLLSPFRPIHLILLLFSLSLSLSLCTLPCLHILMVFPSLCLSSLQLNIPISSILCYFYNSVKHIVFF